MLKEMTRRHLAPLDVYKHLAARKDLEVIRGRIGPWLHRENAAASDHRNRADTVVGERNPERYPDRTRPSGPPTARWMVRRRRERARAALRFTPRGRRHRPTSHKLAARIGPVITAAWRGSFRAEKGRRGRREQPPIGTEFISAVRSSFRAARGRATLGCGERTPAVRTRFYASAAPLAPGGVSGRLGPTLVRQRYFRSGSRLARSKTPIARPPNR